MDDTNNYWCNIERNWQGDASKTSNRKAVISDTIFQFIYWNFYNY